MKPLVTYCDNKSKRLKPEKVADLPWLYFPKELVPRLRVTGSAQTWGRGRSSPPREPWTKASAVFWALGPGEREGKHWEWGKHLQGLRWDHLQREAGGQGRSSAWAHRWPGAPEDLTSPPFRSVGGGWPSPPRPSRLSLWNHLMSGLENIFSLHFGQKPVSSHVTKVPSPQKGKYSNGKHPLICNLLRELFQLSQWPNPIWGSLL